MDRFGDLFLAGAGLALDEHGRAGLGDVADQLEDRVHARALADDVVERVALLQLLAQVHDLVLQAALAQHALDHQTQMVAVDRLGVEVVRPQAHRLHRLLDVAVIGQDDHGDRQGALLDVLDQLQVEARRFQVNQQDTVVLRLQRLQGRRGIVHRIHGDIVSLEQGTELLGTLFLRVDDKDSALHGMVSQGTGTLRQGARPCARFP